MGPFAPNRKRHATLPRKGLRVLIADDMPMFRDGLRLLLKQRLGAVVSAECADLPEAVAALAADPPDLVLIGIPLTLPDDDNQPPEDGIELARRVVLHGAATAATAPALPALMLSLHAGAEWVRRAHAAGARGYLLKNAAPDEIVEAIEVVLAGGRFLSPSVTASLIDAVSGVAGTARAPHQALTARQLQVLRLVGQGLSTRAIAQALGIGTKTVDAHRFQISQRLQVHDVAGMVRYTIRHGLVAVPS